MAQKKSSSVLVSVRIKRNIYDKVKRFLETNKKLSLSALINMGLNEIFENSCLLDSNFDVYVEKNIFIEMFGLQKLKKLIQDKNAEEITISQSKKLIGLKKEIYKELLKENILNGFLKDD